jgi:hypothetical protein
MRCVLAVGRRSLQDWVNGLHQRAAPGHFLDGFEI